MGNGNGTCPLKTNPKIRYSCELAKPLGTPSGLNPQLVQNAEWVLLKPLRSPSSQLGFNRNSFLKSLAVLFGERRKKVIAFWNLDNNWLPNLGNCGSFKNIFRTTKKPWLKPSFAGIHRGINSESRDSKHSGARSGLRNHPQNQTWTNMRKYVQQ